MCILKIKPNLGGMSAALHTLKTYWGYSAFRPLQAEIVEAAIQSLDVVALLPTGGGKSICYQVPALVRGGLTLVISPLIALMKDQVEQLKKRNISATLIDASMRPREIHLTLDNAINGHYKLLYISPERLQSHTFTERIPHMAINLLAVDEAHCISQWGYDFRPHYLQIATFRQLCPGVPIIAVTATATPQVKNDIVEKLQLKNPAIFQKSFSRANLSYSVFNTENKEAKMLQILKNVPGTSVVYAGTRNKCKTLADFLLKAGIPADFYHAGLPYHTRTYKQQQWMDGHTRVMVATNAFGMGIDKADVRTVIHYEVPNNPEAYYQEAGRAGRDEKKAFAVALYNNEDIEALKASALEQFPDIDFIKKVYQALANYLQVAGGSANGLSFDFDFSDFIKKFSLPTPPTFYALKHLEQQGFIVFNESFYAPSKLYIPDRNELYKFQVANKNVDPFIKSLLRIYGGELFNGFVKINEADIATICKISKEEAIKTLAGLHKSSIVEYTPRKDSPQIQFLQQRYPANELPFQTNFYRQRKENALAKADAMIRYLTIATVCRTRALVNYFGEELTADCGVCDVCLYKKKQPDKAMIAEKMMELLRVSPLMPTQLVGAFTERQKDAALEIIKKWLEAELVTYNADGSICITK